MRRPFFIAVLFLFQTPVFAQKKVVKDLDGDLKEDTVYIAGSKIICRLSSQQYRKVSSKELDTFFNAGSPRGKNGRIIVYIISMLCMIDKLKHRYLNIFIAGVWIVNGLYCKVFNGVPRHQQIVARILPGSYPRPLTFLIGLAEIGMAVWILTGIRTQLNTIVQVLLIAIMNTLEFFLAPDLLLWGRANAIFACILILVICYNEYRFNKVFLQN